MVVGFAPERARRTVGDVDGEPVPEWVVAELVSAARVRVRCRRCGDEYELYGRVPYELGALATLLGSFVDEHRACVGAAPLLH